MSDINKTSRHGGEVVAVVPLGRLDATSMQVVLGLLDEIATLRAQQAMRRPAPQPPDNCCGRYKWTCQYHMGYRDGWEAYDEDHAERVIWDEMTT